MSTSTLKAVVLTGGPCAGETTALERITRWLRQQGMVVCHLHEASTLLLSGGVRVREATREQLIAFQAGIVRVQLALEEAFAGCARAFGRPAVLLCDRGVLDGAAYLPGEDWRRLLAECDLREQ